MSRRRGLLPFKLSLFVKWCGKKWHQYRKLNSMFTYELKTSVRGVKMYSRRVDCSTPPALSAESSMTNRGQQIYLQLRRGVPLLRWIIHSSKKSLSKFKTLTRGNRVAYSDCSLNIMSPISELRLSLLSRHIVDFFPTSTFDFGIAVQGFIRAFMFL